MLREIMEKILAEEQAEDKATQARMDSLYPVPEPIKAGLETGFKEAAEIPEPEQSKAEQTRDSDDTPVCGIERCLIDYSLEESNFRHELTGGCNGGGCSGPERPDRDPSPSTPCP